MYKEEDGKYYSICDDCGLLKEIQKQAYKNGLKRGYCYCLSCGQKGNKNHRYNKHPWNYGLTSATDERVKSYNQKQSITKKGREPWNKGRTYEELKGKKWAKDFKLKVSRVKSGVPNYKKRGLATDYAQSFWNIRQLIAGRIYSSWTYPILERDNFTCRLCGTKKCLEVHHLEPFTFKKILITCADQLGLNLSTWRFWDNAIIEPLADLVIAQHKVENGITLCKECHSIIDRYRNIKGKE